MRWACCMLVCALALASAISWTASARADAARSLPGTSQALSLPGSEARKWYPISGTIFGWSRLANKEDAGAERHSGDKLFSRSRAVEREEAEEKHPADKLLRRHKADMTESYILGGY